MISRSWRIRRRLAGRLDQYDGMMTGGGSSSIMTVNISLDAWNQLRSISLSSQTMLSLEAIRLSNGEYLLEQP